MSRSDWKEPAWVFLGIILLVPITIAILLGAIAAMFMDAFKLGWTEWMER